MHWMAQMEIDIYATWWLDLKMKCTNQKNIFQFHYNCPQCQLQLFCYHLSVVFSAFSLPPMPISFVFHHLSLSPDVLLFFSAPSTHKMCIMLPVPGILFTVSKVTVGWWLKQPNWLVLLLYFFIFYIYSELLILLQPKLIWCYIIIGRSVLGKRLG